MFRKRKMIMIMKNEYDSFHEETRNTDLSLQFRFSKISS